MFPFVFPPAFAVTLGLVGGAIVARLVTREWHRINDELDRNERAAATDPKVLPTLRRDPRTGVWRPDTAARPHAER